MACNDDDLTKQLLETFKVEAEEHITTLINYFVELEKSQGNLSQEKLQEIYREAHSLKGAARAVNLETIQNICQSFENVLSNLRDKKIPPSQEMFSLGFEVLDYIKTLLENPQGEIQNPEAYSSFIERLTAICEPKSTEPLKQPPQTQTTPAPEEKKEEPPAPPPEEEKTEPPSSSNEDPLQNDLYATFKMESEQLIQTLTTSINSLQTTEGELPADALEALHRNMHSLKGAARAVDFDAAMKLGQTLEDLFLALKEKKIQPSKEFFQISLECLKFIQSLIETKKTEEESRIDTISLIEKLNALGSPPTKIEEFSISEPPKQEAPKQEAGEKSTQKGLPSDKLLKISSGKLDNLIVKIEELLSIKIMYNKLLNDLSTTFEAVKKAEKLQKNLSNTKHFLQHRLDPNIQYYDQLCNLIDGLTLSINDTILFTTSSLNALFKNVSKDKYVVDDTISSLLGDTKKLLMQPFSTMLEVFPRMVRDLSLELKKEINLQVEGETVEIDRRILDELKDPLMHIIRNSVDHGIEPPEEREKKGKPRAGVVKLAISQVGGNHVDMDFSDDGRGFNLEKIKAKAIEQQVITMEEASHLSDDEIARLAFESGVSTADIITELSGRGVGLNILMEKIEKLGGTYTVHTEKDKGSSFHISLPLTMATFGGLQIVAANREFVIPTKNIKRILRKGGFELSTVENEKVIFLDDKNYPFKFLSDLLNLEVKEEPSVNLILLLSSGLHEIAIGVDKLIEEHEIFIKGLGKQLEHVPNVSAGTILEGGKVIPILDAADLIKTAIASPSRRATAPGQTSEDVTEKKTVVIAEDTMTTRLLFKNILEGAGYTVITACDGVEAYEILLKQNVDLLVTDVEMPRMTGFELVEKLHSNEKTKDIPVIIITARESIEDKKRGTELGASAYIEKSSFLQNELISITKKLI